MYMNYILYTIYLRQNHGVKLSQKRIREDLENSERTPQIRTAGHPSRKIRVGRSAESAKIPIAQVYLYGAFHQWDTQNRWFVREKPLQTLLKLMI